MTALFPTASVQRPFNGERALAYTHPAKRKARLITTVSIKNDMFAEMLALCADNRQTVFAFIKEASLSADPTGHKSWSDAVRVAALHKMRGSYKPGTRMKPGIDSKVVFSEGLKSALLDTVETIAADADAKLAADNNAAWEGQQ